MRKATRGKAARDQDKEITALMRMKDEGIDLSDIPEITDWSKAVVGKFYRPVKKARGFLKGIATGIERV